MPDFRRARCLPQRGGCGRHQTEVGLISWGGLCIDCAKRRAVENNEDLHYHRGPYFAHWRRATALSVGAVLVDDLEALMDADG